MLALELEWMKSVGYNRNHPHLFVHHYHHLIHCHKFQQVPCKFSGDGLGSGVSLNSGVSSGSIVSEVPSGSVLESD